MSFLRSCAAVSLLLVTLVLQVTLFSHLSWQGVVPNLVLLVVVGAGIMRGAQFGAGLGFVAGLLVDLAPPADHVAGRWALAFVLVGFVVGRIREESGIQGRPSTTAAVLAVAGSSFVATSIFAFSGVLLGETPLDLTGMLTTILIALIWDVLMTPLMLPLVMRVFARGEPDFTLGPRPAEGGLLR